MTHSVTGAYLDGIDKEQALQAAAPEMLEALEHLLLVATHIWGHSESDSCIKEARAAINKAKGL